MVLTIPVGQADGHLAELVRNLGPDDQIGLTEDGRLVARIVPAIASSTSRRRGVCRGMLELLDESDDVILERFNAYLP